MVVPQRCLPSAGTSTLSTRASSTSAGMQAPQSPPTFQAEPGGFLLGQVHPFSNSFQPPPTLCRDSRNPGVRD